MKPNPKKLPAMPPETLESFGGDYHRLESTYRPKKTPPDRGQPPTGDQRPANVRKKS